MKTTYTTVVLCLLFNLSTEALIVPAEFGHGPSEDMFVFPEGSEVLAYGKLTNGELPYPGQDLPEIGIVSSPQDPVINQSRWALMGAEVNGALSLRGSQMTLAAHDVVGGSAYHSVILNGDIPTANMVRLGVTVSDPTLIRRYALGGVFVGDQKTPVTFVAGAPRNWFAVDVPLTGSTDWSVKFNFTYMGARGTNPEVNLYVIPFRDPSVIGEGIGLNLLGGESYLTVTPKLNEEEYPSDHLEVVKFLRVQEGGVSYKLNFELETGYLNRSHTVEVLVADQWLPYIKFCPAQNLTQISIRNLTARQSLFVRVRIE